MAIKNGSVSMPATKKKRVTSKKPKQPKQRFGKLRLAGAVIALVGVGFLLAGVREVLPTSTVVQRFPGDPNPLVSGKAFFGSSGEHIAEHEAATGKSVALYRKFYQWGQSANAANDIKSNYTANRLMWISLKTPKWADVANGTYDTTLLFLGMQVNSLGLLDSIAPPLSLWCHIS